MTFEAQIKRGTGRFFPQIEAEDMEEATRKAQELCGVEDVVEAVREVQSAAKTWRTKQ